MKFVGICVFSLIDKTDCFVAAFVPLRFHSFKNRYFEMGKKSALPADPSQLRNIVDGLKVLYKKKIRPLEELYRFDQFHSALLTDTDIEAKPFILLMGQYSTGKTTFIKYLLDEDYPGSNIGPEPTTDRFVAVMNGAGSKVIPGNAACVAADMPFTGLTKFGSAFMGKFQVSQVPVPFLEHVTIIDTPGVLSGEKQRIGRAYDFVQVCEWFAERADAIILLFDAHKLDISDEFKSVIETLKPHSDKIKVILNKADMINNQQLMRIYGALMWSLGKVINTPEVVRVYVGSFWDDANKDSENYALLQAEQADLLSDLRDLPRNAAVRKINEIVKRARMAKVHSYIIGHLKKEMPAVFGKNAKQQELIDNLDQEFLKVQKQYHLPVGDFPDLERFRANLKTQNFADFPKANPKLVAAMDEVLSIDLPRLMQMFPQGNPSLPEHVRNPFADFAGSQPLSPDTPLMQHPWMWESVEKSRWTLGFQKLNPVDGRISGTAVKPVLVESGLPVAELGVIWGLADVTEDGYLDQDEFCIAMHLIRMRQQGLDLPGSLPDTMLPPKTKI